MLPTALNNIPAGPIGTVSVTGGSYDLTGLNVNTLTLNGGSLSGGAYTVNADYSDAG